MPQRHLPMQNVIMKQNRFWRSSSWCSHFFFTIQRCSATYQWYSYHCRKIVLPVRVAILGFIFYFHDAPAPTTCAKCNNKAKSFLVVQLVMLTLIFFTIQSCSATYLWYSYNCRKIVLPVRVAILGLIFYFHDASAPPTHAKCNNEAKSFLALQLVMLTLTFFTMQSYSATYLCKM